MSAVTLETKGAFRPAAWNGWPVAALLPAPLLVVLTLLAVPELNPHLGVPGDHFLIVSAVAGLALTLATIMAVGVSRIRDYKGLLLVLGFMAMAGIFTVHGLATPGFIVPVTRPGVASVTGISAYLSLLVPSILFTVAMVPGVARLERRLPFTSAGSIVILIGVALAVYALLAFLRVVEGLPLNLPPANYFLATLSVALLGLAAWRQAHRYFITRLPMQGALAGAFVLLAEAQVTMVSSKPYTVAWWLYHLLMLAGVCVALRALALEWVGGRSLRAIVEGALDLEVSAGIELENVDSIAALAAAIELKDHDTQGHTLRVAELSVRVGRQMGLDNRSLRVLARAGLLHDIGKLGIPDSILVKPGPLDPDEWRVMKTHPQLGLDILARCGILPREAEIIRAHHERMDGSGYPSGLDGPEIPIEARIIAVADTYDVLLSDRPYRRALPHAAAVQVLLKEAAANKLYDAAVEALLRVVENDEDLHQRRVVRGTAG